MPPPILKSRNPRLNRQALGAKGIVGAWAFAEGAGNVLRDSALGNNATPVSGMPSWVAGRAGAALSFNSTEMDATIAPSIGGAATATLIVSFYRGSTANSVYVGPGTIGQANRFNIQWYSDGNIYFTAGNSDSNAYFYCALPGTGWHTAAMVFNGNLTGNARVIAFVDGLQKTLTYANTPPATLATVAAMGSMAFGLGSSVGLIDSVKLYNVALIPSQIMVDAQDSFRIYRQPLRQRVGTSGGTVYSGTIAEAMALVDTNSSLAIFASAAVEAVALADSPSSLAVFGSVVSETNTLADTPTALAIFGSTVAEANAFEDTTASAAIFTGTVAETLALLDSPASAAIFVSVIAEALSLLDLTTTGNIYADSVTEAISLADVTDAASIFVGALAEAASLTDSTDAASVFAGAIVEAVSLLDHPSSLAVLVAQVVETLTLVDAPTSAATLYSLVLEVMSLVDSVTLPVGSLNVVAQADAPLFSVRPSDMSLFSVAVSDL